MSGDFSGPLAVGTVRGARSFEVDAYGRLHGIYYPAIWVPGENASHCFGQSAAAPYQAFAQAISSVMYTLPSPPAPKTTKPLPASKEHSLDRCTCGFYGYFDGSNDYGAPSRISGIVEGYGRTVIGSRGFRSEKARLVALCVERRPYRFPLTRVFARYPTVANIGFPLSVCVAIVAFILAFVTTKSGTSLAPSMVPLVMLAAFFAFRSGPAAFSIGTPADGDGAWLSKEQIALVRRNYPDLPFYTSFRQMVADFPPDKATVPSPETDAEFWTRA